METFRIDNDQELVLENGNWILHKSGVPVTGIPKSIYKYYSLNNYNIDALKKRYFYLSNPKDFNDPFDCSFNLIIEQQKAFVSGFPAPSLNDVANKGISCFSTNGLDPLMWGHYTGAYHGFVIEFQTDLQIIRVPELIREKLMRVIYSQNPNPVSEKSPFANQFQLVVKLAHWSYENEWRLIVDKNDNSMDKLHYDASSIKSFSFGYQMSDSGKTDEHYQLRDSLMQVILENYSSVPKFTVGPAATELKLKRLPLYEAAVEDFDDFKIVLK